jgi:hypothetical protein
LNVSSQNGPVSARSELVWAYRLGATAAATVVALILIQAPLLIIYPYPTTVLGHLVQIHEHKLVGLINGDLIMLISELLSVLIFIGLFAALRKANPLLMNVALGLGLASIVVYVAVNPTFSFLYLSDQYSAATTDAQRASFLAAGQALWANYQGTGFVVAYLGGGLATVLIAAVMLGSTVFSRWVALVGFVAGATMLVPPLPALGTIGLIAAYASLIPLVLWYLVLAWRFFRLAAFDDREAVASSPRIVHWQAR